MAHALACKNVTTYKIELKANNILDHYKILITFLVSIKLHFDSELTKIFYTTPS